MDNMGSFGSMAGGVSPELQEAIQRRQGGQTQAVTQGAPGFDPMQQPASPPQGNAMPMPQGGNMPFSPVSGQPAPSQAPTNDTTGGMPVSPESSIILKALDGRLRSISKQEEAVIGIGA